NQGQALNADIVQVVFCGVPEAVVGSVVEVDDVDRRDTSLGEWDVVIENASIAEVADAIADTLCFRHAEEGFCQVLGSIGGEGDAEILVADHVEEDHGSDLLEGAIGGHGSSEALGAVEPVLVAIVMDTLFAIEEG